MMLRFGNCFVLYLLLFLASLAGCGSRSNILYFTVPDEHKESYDFFVGLAEVEYDRGSLKRALEYSEIAYTMVPESERAAILYGFINLSLAGGEPFKLARSLIASSEKSNNDRLKANLESGDTERQKGSSTGSLLTSLRSTLEISDDDISAISIRDDSDPEIPLVIPNCVEQARQALLRLQLINKSILAVCPFVDLDVRIAGDPRQICRKFLGVRKKTNQAHFLWAFSHLLEALIFHSVITYGTSDSSDGLSNLEKMVEKINTREVKNQDDFREFSNSVTVIQKTIDRIMPISGICSATAPTTQLRATMNDLLAVHAAFSRMAGISSSIIGSVTKALQSIQSLENNQDSLQAKKEQIKVLRRDFTKSFSETLSRKIDAVLTDSSSLSSEEQKKLCSDFDELSKGQDVPEKCNQFNSL